MNLDAKTKRLYQFGQISSIIRLESMKEVKEMKKLTIMVLVGTMTLSMAACGVQESSNTNSKLQTQNTIQKKDIYLTPDTVVALQRCYNKLKDLDNSGMVIYDDVVTFSADEGEVVCLKVGCAKDEGVVDGIEVEISFDEYGLVDDIVVESNSKFIGAREWYLTADTETQRKASEKFTCYDAMNVVSEMRSWKGYENTFLAQNYLKN